MLGNSDIVWGWPAKLLHWIGAILIFAAARTRLVDGAHGAPPGSARALRRPRGARLRFSGAAGAASVVALDPRGACAARRNAAMGAPSRARQPHRALSADVCHDAGRLGAGRHDAGRRLE